MVGGVLTALARRLGVYGSGPLLPRLFGNPLPPKIPHIRFWIGYADDRLTKPEFLEGLKKVLIPDTTAVGSGKGLIGYMPVVPGKAFYRTGSPPGVLTTPDEFALVVYRDEAVYQAIRKTPEGAAYGAHHFNLDDIADKIGLPLLKGKGFFVKEASGKGTSGSAVVQAYQGKVEIGSAYVTRLKERFDWQGRTVYVRIRIRNTGVSDSDYLSSIQRSLNWTSKQKQLTGHIVRVEKDFTLEYFMADDMGDWVRFLSNETAKILRKRHPLSHITHSDWMIEVKPLPNSAAQSGTFPLDWRSGYQLVFPTEPWDPTHRA